MIRYSENPTLAPINRSQTRKFPPQPRISQASRAAPSICTALQISHTSANHTFPPISLQTAKMGKERVEKKEKKEKRSSKDGVKKSKKDKKTKVVDEVVTAALEEQLKEAAAPVAEARVQVTEQEGELVVKAVGALVPFAAPLADEKVAKKVLKSVKKGTC